MEIEGLVEISDEYIYQVMHIGSIRPGEIKGCFGIAFYANKKLKATEIVEPHIFMLLNGSIPKDGDDAKCGSCGQDVALADWCLQFELREKDK